MICNVVEF